MDFNVTQNNHGTGNIVFRDKILTQKTFGLLVRGGKTHLTLPQN